MDQYYEEILVPPTVQSFSRIENFVERICDSYNINFSYSGNILTCLSEAFQNCIQHAKSTNWKSVVLIAFEKQEHWLRFYVEDEGAGFDVDAHKLPNGEFSSRGLFLMQSLSDQMEFSLNGRRLCISFDLDLINRTIAENRQREMELLLKKGISASK